MLILTNGTHILCSSSVISLTAVLLLDRVIFQMANFLPNEGMDEVAQEAILHLKILVSSSNALCGTQMPPKELTPLLRP